MARAVYNVVRKAGVKEEAPREPGRVSGKRPLAQILPCLVEPSRFKGAAVANGMNTGVKVSSCNRPLPISYRYRKCEILGILQPEKFKQLCLCL